jgi:hypothetical protein
MNRKFAENSTYESRALQAYLVLVGLASNRQTATYGQLSEKMKYGGGRGDILAWPLGKLMRWCKTNHLPALTALIVDGTTGLPSHGLTTVDGNEFSAEQQRIFGFDWFTIMPPTLDELNEAH